MTIADRINLHRCGYSKAEIAELAAAEKAELEAAKTVPDPAPAQEQVPAQDPTPAPDPILSAINNLTAAIQANNIIRTPAPAQQPSQTVDDLIKNI